MKVRITADSTCDLSKELIDAYKIEIAPLYIVMGDKAYRDGVDITSDDVFARAAADGKIASTAAVNVDDYLHFFGECKQDCDAIVHFTISSEMSSCYQNACIAARELGNIYIIDSRTLSLGMGLMILEAAEMAESGADAETIVRNIEERKALTDVSFVVNTLDHLRMGGRCSALAALGANMLSLKPCIEVKEGKMGVAKKYRGHLDRCMQKYVAERLEDPSTVDTRRVFVVDSGLPKEVIDGAVEEMGKHVAFEEILYCRAGCTISNHCGPKAFGIMFCRKA